jgi:riboflavin synthase
MFTGLIEEIGTIDSVKNIGGGKHFIIAAKKIMDDLEIDDSVSINGVCQTVVSRNDKTFEVTAVEETLRKSTLGNFTNGDKVNLERAAAVGDRLGGHIVQGHVDCVAYVKSIEKEQTGILVWVEYPREYNKYVVIHGSIAIEGVSLTVARENSSAFMVSIIPHTWDVTTLRDLKPGKKINIEFDILGKYIEKMLKLEKSYTPTGLEKFIDQPDW